MYIKLQNFGVANRAEVIHKEIPDDWLIRREKVFIQSYQDIKDLFHRLRKYYTPFLTPCFSEEWWDSKIKNQGVDLLILHFEKETANGVIAPRDPMIVSNTVMYYMNNQGDTIDKTRV